LSYYIGGSEAKPNSKDVIENENFIKPFEPVSIKGMVSDGDIIGVISDGVGSFSQSDGMAIPWEDIVFDFIGFRTTPGVFVQRRLSFLKRQWIKNQISHHDDISMAAIVV
jgi:hypothetical protein